MMGECNCACMPLPIPFDHSGLLFFLQSLGLIQLFPFPSLVSSFFFFPWYNPLLWLTLFFGYVLCLIPVLCLCVFFCFSSISDLIFLLKMFVFLWSICLWDFCFFFKLMLLCFTSLGVQMPNETISVFTASVPVILFKVIHYWKNWTWSGLIGFHGDFRQPLKDAIYTVV